MSIKDLKFVDYRSGLIVTTASFPNDIGLIIFYSPDNPTYGYAVYIYYKGSPLRVKGRLYSKLTFVETSTLEQILNCAKNNSAENFSNYINELSVHH